MAAVNSEQVTPSNESFNGIRTPNDTLDQPYDVVLVVEDGKQFKAHRKVLSETSSFFEKLLSSDMKESKEGIVRLEMFSKSVMAATLEFIYTGHVEILTEDNARDLIVMADYLLLPKLQTFAEGVLAQKLNISNCISTYYFSERYQCEDLLSEAKKFILANFTAVYTANREDVMNMSSKEVEMWISRDEIAVSAEEDVFKIILAWIDHDKSNRRNYFAELFRQVRLVYVSRDFLSSDVVTNDLVKENEDCMDLVKEAMSLIDSKNFDNLSVSPRKSLETTVIVMYIDRDILCYFFDQDNWFKLGEVPLESSRHGKFAPCDGKLYSTVNNSSNFPPLSLKHVMYNSYSNSWMRFPSLEVEDKYIEQVYTRNGEMYAVMSDSFWRDYEKIILPTIMKYKVESNSWEEIPISENLGLRYDICIVAQDNFIYFIGGIGWYSPGEYQSDVHRYNLNTNQWDRVADIQVARKRAHGAAANGKIFIAGGVCQGRNLPKNCECEMYSETTNEWQFITSFSMKPDVLVNLLAVDGKLYALGRTHEIQNMRECDLHVQIECYEAEKNEWKITTETAIPSCSTAVGACSMRIFKGLFNIGPDLETFPPASLAGATTKAGKRKCVIM